MHRAPAAAEAMLSLASPTRAPVRKVAQLLCDDPPSPVRVRPTPFAATSPVSPASSAPRAPAPIAKRARRGGWARGARGRFVERARPAESAAPQTVPPRRGKFYQNATPSSHCHVCARTAKAVRFAVCARLAAGLCRKVICDKCFARFGWDWDAAAADPAWTCPHCRGACPPGRSQCFIYARVNRRRETKRAARAAAAAATAAAVAPPRSFPPVPPAARTIPHFSAAQLAPVLGVRELGSAHSAMPCDARAVTGAVMCGSRVPATLHALPREHSTVPIVQLSETMASPLCARSPIASAGALPRLSPLSPLRVDSIGGNGMEAVGDARFYSAVRCHGSDLLNRQTLYSSPLSARPGMVCAPQNVGAMQLSPLSYAPQQLPMALPLPRMLHGALGRHTGGVATTGVESLYMAQSPPPLSLHSGR